MSQRSKTQKKKAPSKSRSKNPSTKKPSQPRPRADPRVRKRGLYQHEASKCSEITTARTRCKNDALPGTMFCRLHRRRPHQHEDDYFDSTFARVTDGIWIGSLDTANDPKALRSAGIKGIINISGWEPRKKTQDMYRLWKPRPIAYYTTTTLSPQTGRLRYLGDQPITSRDELVEFYDYMDRGVEMVTKCPKPCLIHCHAGINRSASLVAAYLMAKKGMSFTQARALLEHANRKREISVLTNKDFVDAMNRYQSHLRTRRLSEH